MQAERERLLHLDELATNNAQAIKVLIIPRLDNVKCKWIRQDAVLLVNIALILENWSIYDVTLNKLTGEVKRNDNTKITDIRPILDPRRLSRQVPTTVNVEFDWQISDSDSLKLQDNNRTFGIKIKVLAYIKFQNDNDISIPANLTANVDLSGPKPMVVR